jgi:hypothetical protein
MTPTPLLPLSVQEAGTFIADAMEQTSRVLPVSVPLGTSVESALAEHFAQGLFLDGPPVPLGVSPDGSAVYSVTLTRTNETRAFSAGIAGMIYLREDLPQIEAWYQEEHERIVERQGGSGLYNARLERTRLAVHEAAKAIDDLAELLERFDRPDIRMQPALLREAASSARSHWARP